MLLIAAVLAQDVVLDEPLLTGASADEVRGGTFTGAGWRVDDANARLYWDLGTQIERGDLSVTIDDISWDNLLLANNHLIELFSDGGHSSDNRAINLRLYGYGDGDPYGEWGDLKLLGWDRTTDPDGEDRVSEERYYGLDWDGLAHTWRITWDPTDFVLYRDGLELIHTDVTGIDLRVRYLWLPLEDWGGDYSAPIGTLYSDLHLEGWEPGPTEDTGQLPDDGDPTTFLPVEDVTAASWEGGVYSDPEDLAVEGDGTQQTAVTWLEFDLSGVTEPIVSAQLRLHARPSDDADGDAGTLYTAADSSWTEETLTWANQPALGAAAGSYGHVSPGDVLEFDVSSVVSGGGPAVFALASTGANGTHLASKEAGDGADAPLLIVTTSASAGGDTGAGEDSAGDTSTKGEDDASPPGALVKAEGCGCTTATPTPAAWAFGLLALARRR